MTSKGATNKRWTSSEKYRDNWDKIFGIEPFKTYHKFDIDRAIKECDEACLKIAREYIEVAKANLPDDSAGEPGERHIYRCATHGLTPHEVDANYDAYCMKCLRDAFKTHYSFINEPKREFIPVSSALQSDADMPVATAMYLVATVSCEGLPEDVVYFIDPVTGLEVGKIINVGEEKE